MLALQLMKLAGMPLFSSTCTSCFLPVMVSYVCTWQLVCLLRQKGSLMLSLHQVQIDKTLRQSWLTANLQLLPGRQCSHTCCAWQSADLTSEMCCPLNTIVRLHVCKYRLRDLVISAAKVLAKKRAQNKHDLQQAVSPTSNKGFSVRL